MSQALQLHQKKRSAASRSDEYATIKDLYKRLCKEYKIYPKLDVCATKENRKCRRFYFIKEKNPTTGRYRKTNRRNGLKLPWTSDWWCNPPQTEAQTFIIRGDQQWREFNRNGIMIIPANSTVTKAGAKLLWNKKNPRMYPLLPSPKFIYNGNLTEETARNRYLVVIWRKRKPKK